jgi:putative ABC transport system permease protein
MANFVAWPLGYYLMHKWLQGYAYRCPLGVDTFLLSGLTALLIALITVSIQTIKASWTSPLETINHE